MLNGSEGQQRVDATALDLQVRQVLNMVIREEYPKAEYQDILAVEGVDNLAEWIEIPCVTARGQAAWLSDDRGNVYPTVTVEVDVLRVKPKPCGIGVEYTGREAKIASRGVIDGVKEKTAAALLAVEQHMDEAFMLGSEAENIRGFFTHPYLPIVASDTVFASGTSAQDMYDALTALVADQRAAANHVEGLYADTLFLTERVYGVLGRKIMNSTTSKSVLAAFLENCELMKQPLQVRISRWLATAGYGGIERIGVGRMDVAKAFLAENVNASPIEYANALYKQYYNARVAGAFVPKPLAFRYLEGTAG